MEVRIQADEGNFVKFRTEDGAAALRGTDLKLPCRFVA
jgi:hypothetical protein